MTPETSTMLQRVKSFVKRAPYVRRLVQQRDDANRRADQLGHELEMLRQPDARPAYAHWGEDQIAAWLFENRPRGFYVDIGAYHPVLYSNTKLLFDKGWRGINVDCNPAMMAHFRNLRPNDVNLHAAVAGKEGTVTFYRFHEWASSNTISRQFADSIAKSQNIEIEQEIPVHALPLRKILDRHLPAGERIDFLNVDVESVDLEVLESNDWDKYRPLVVAIEDIGYDFDNPKASPTYNFLRERGYRPISRTIYTNFFADDSRRGELNGCP
jgi:FkbM family methyltransferase